MSGSDHDEIVRRSFERQVPLFSGSDSPFAHRATSAQSWIEPLNDEMIVLDVACGAGHATDPVAPRVRQVVGIDLTDALLRVGQQRLHDAGIGNVLLQHGNAESLPFVDESFDIVYCRSSLHHFGDPRRAVDEMVRVCRGDGRVVLVDLIVPSEGMRDRYDHVHRLLDPSHVRAFMEAELAVLLRDRVANLTYGEKTTIRLPIDIAFTEQSESAAVIDILAAEARGDGEPTGFDPVDEDGKLVVSFTSCVVHGQRA